MAIDCPPERCTRDPENCRAEYEEIRKYLKTFSDTTIRNIFRPISNCSVPDKVQTILSKIRFRVGEGEWSDRYRNLKWYRKCWPQIGTVTIPRMLHG